MSSWFSFCLPGYVMYPCTYMYIPNNWAYAYHTILLTYTNLKQSSGNSSGRHPSHRTKTPWHSTRQSYGCHRTGPQQLMSVLQPSWILNRTKFVTSFPANWVMCLISWTGYVFPSTTSWKGPIFTPCQSFFGLGRHILVDCKRRVAREIPKSSWLCDTWKYCTNYRLIPRCLGECLSSTNILCRYCRPIQYWSNLKKDVSKVLRLLCVLQFQFNTLTVK
jgi:hypothetical protein